MPTKTERILSYLPGTFRAAFERSALRAVVEAFGRELLEAENSLAALMRAHWVDHADRGAEEVDDLKRLAALYGLEPRNDEGVEEFREHLKRYVGTFLDGTVTVQGILRVTAEALGLHIADDPGDLDAWWRRRGDVLETVEPRRDDAAEILFGHGILEAAGAAARPARVEGTIDLSSGVDLREAPRLWLKVYGQAHPAIDLAAAAADPSRVTLAEIVDAINEDLGSEVAGRHGSHLVLTSPSAGPASELKVQSIPTGDAALAVLGLAPRSYRGAKAEPATVTGHVLAAPVDLRQRRYLRLEIDGTHLAEIDCAGADPAATSLDEIVGAINGGLGLEVASHDGQHLTLASPTSGSGSVVAFREPAVGDARPLLFGEVALVHTGRDPRPARVIGRDLSGGVDLREASKIRLKIDGGTASTLDLAGAAPEVTTLDEIVATLEAALGAGVARHDGRRPILISPSVGGNGRITFQPLSERDAGEAVFGIRPRVFAGAGAEPARLASDRDLGSGGDLRARHVLRLAVDGGEPIDIDLAAGAEEPEHVHLTEIVAAINEALEATVASHDGRSLALTSPTAGATSRLAVGPLEDPRRRRFVTRAVVTDEASRALLGFLEHEARGIAATRARVVGGKDLKHGVDLREDRYLRLAVDGGSAVDVDGAGARPRATTLDEIVAAINIALDAPVASHDGRHVILSSPSEGEASRIAFEPPRAQDALGPLMGVEPGTVRGREATGVRFTGTADLATGLDLPAGAAVHLGVDEAEPREIVLTEPAARLGPAEVVSAINRPFLAAGRPIVASHDGHRILLTSRARGPESRVEFCPPAGADATSDVFGITAPRLYEGEDARPAVVRGEVDLRAGIHLTKARFLRLSVDGAPVATIDVAAGAADPAAVALGEILAAINDTLGHGVASSHGGRLVLTSPTTGLSSRVTLECHTSGDARERLFGKVAAETSGRAATPAVITGEVDLLSPADLDDRRRLRLRVDGGRPVEIDVAGTEPAETSLEDVVEALEAVHPGLASATDDARLRLTSPTAGEASRLEVLPLRWLEVQEYPPEPRTSRRTARHGELWPIVHSGAAETPLEVEIRPSHGAFAPALADLERGWSIRLMAAVGRGETARVWRDPESGLWAVILDAEGGERCAPILVESLSPETGSGGPEGLLSLPRGRSRFLFRQGRASRFDAAHFAEDDISGARFTGEPCAEGGVFGASRFGPTEPVEAIFGRLEPAPPVEVTLRYEHHRPGAFEVHLPADLPERFGGRFNEARFGTDETEKFPGTVTEPPDDEDHLVTLIHQGKDGRGEEAPVSPSRLVSAHVVPSVPLGWEAVTMPFRKPHRLTLGDPSRPARLYLAEEEVDGFLEMAAREPGSWGNQIAVSVRPAGQPARWDVEISLAGPRFENARQVVLGAPPPSLAQELAQPGPIGVLQAKAAGVEARVTRDRATLAGVHNPRSSDHDDENRTSLHGKKSR